MAGERQALIAQMVERALGKGKVMGSNPIEGSLQPSSRSGLGYQSKETEQHGQAEI